MRPDRPARAVGAGAGLPARCAASCGPSRPGASPLRPSRDQILVGARQAAKFRYGLPAGLKLCALTFACAELEPGHLGQQVSSAAAMITVNVALIQVGGRLTWGKPKSRAGERVVGLDKGTVAAGRAHRARRSRERLAAGEAWQDSGRLFTREDGAPLYPEQVTRTFKFLAKAAGLPVIRFHSTRHTAATLALEAGIGTKIVSEQLGHSTTRITEDLYQHVRVQVQIDAAETTVALLPDTKGARKTGS
jgi:integrase